jgi:hypothetical protein
MANPQIVVDYKSNTAGLSKGLKSAESGIGKLGKSLSGVAKIGVAAAGAAGVGALVATLKVGIGEFNESQKVMAQTGAVIKSTGGAANVTAKQIGDLAEATMRKTGIDDEAVAAGENMLLTFTNVRNEVGKGNDVFTQAAGTMTDMSVALGQDMTTSALQLGKALNDPVKGMTALQRVGVTFTKAQKEQVAAMVESGDAMGAQKLILKELNKEFGGSAEAIGKTLPGQLSILRESFNNLAGDLASRLMPTILNVANGMLGFVNRFAEAEGAGAKFRVAVDAIKAGATDVGNALVSAFQAIDWAAVGSTIVNGLVSAAKAAFDGLKAAFNAVNFAAVGQIVGQKLTQALNAVAKYVSAVNWDAVGAAAVRGLGEMVKAIAVFLAGVNWPALIGALFRALVAVLAVQSRILIGAGRELGKAIVDGVQRGAAALGPVVREFIGNLPGYVRSAAVAVLSAAVALARGIVTGVIRGLAGLNAAVTRFMQQIPGWIAAAGAAAAAAAYSIGVQIIQGMVNGVKAMAGSLASAAIDVVMGAVNAARGVLHMKSPSKLWAELGADTIRGYIVGLTTEEPKLKEKTRDVMLKALEAARAAVEAQQERFRATFDRLGEFAGRAFEGRTQAILAGIGARYDAVLAGIEQRAQAATSGIRGLAEALTPAEKAIADIQAAEEARRRDTAVQQAQAAIAAAQTEEARIAAVEQLRQAEQAREIARLQAIAVEERKAQEARAAMLTAVAEQAAKAQAAAVEKQRAKALQNAEEQRRQAAEKLDEQLENLRERLAKHPEEQAKIQKQILRLLNSYGVDYKQAGLDLGKAFAKGLDDAQDDVARSAKALAAVVARYLPHSPAESGPLARTDFFRGFGQMLATNLLSGAGALQSAASRMAGVAAAPLSLQAPAITGGGTSTQVRVFIGDTELRGIVRTEINSSNTGIARTLLAGAR